MSSSTIRALSEQILSETEKIIVGKTDKIRLIVMAILADGHILLEDLPGSARPPSSKPFRSRWAAASAGCSSYPT